MLSSSSKSITKITSFEGLERHDERTEDGSFRVFFYREAKSRDEETIVAGATATNYLTALDLAQLDLAMSYGIELH